jgi:hypothetical protein
MDLTIRINEKGKIPFFMELLKSFDLIEITPAEEVEKTVNRKTKNTIEKTKKNIDVVECKDADDMFNKLGI